MYKKWDMSDGPRFWAVVPCDELFLLFDTSAHANKGIPDVPVMDVWNHVQECGVCTLGNVTVLNEDTTPLLRHDW